MEGLPSGGPPFVCGLRRLIHPQESTRMNPLNLDKISDVLALVARRLNRCRSSRGETVMTTTRKIRDPDTGQILEEYPFDDWLGEVLQEALDRRILEYTGKHNSNGK